MQNGTYRLELIVHIKMTVSEGNQICCFGQRFGMFRADAEGFLQGQAFPW